MFEPFSIKGQKFVVSGASRGIGLNLCNRLVDMGATVVGISRSIRPESLNQEIEYVQYDLNELGKTNQLFEKISSIHPTIDSLINVAGISLPAESSATEIHRFSSTIEVNLTSVFNTTHTLLPMLVQNGGSIVNISSINASIGFPDNPGYVASKSGLSGLTRAMALDYAKHEIRVNSIAPGYFHTGMTDGSYNDPEKYRTRAEKTILGRWGKLDDLVGPIVFLTSTASSYITGVEIAVDGGWTAKGL